MTKDVSNRRQMGLGGRAHLYMMTRRVGGELIGYDIAIPDIEHKEYREVAARKLRDARARLKEACDKRRSAA